MHLIKHAFTITDLENISGIKAHTIRIWEKRYKLLQPERGTRNIRYYNIEHLQKLLNISVLYQQGWKISKIASLSEEDIISQTKIYINQEKNVGLINNELKLAMYKFDKNLFEESYQRIIKQNSFSKVYQEVFAPLLHFTGLLWQTHSINPAHEHFISNLIVQKILLQTTLLKEIKPIPNKPTFVLSLPEEEMHEISLLYFNYELKLRGYHTIYIGRSISFKDLTRVGLFYPLITWISIFTTNPSINKINTHIKEVQSFLKNNDHEYWLIGNDLSNLKQKSYPLKLKIFPSVKEALSILNSINDSL